MNKNMFKVLVALKRQSGLSQRELAQLTGLSLGSVNTAYKDLAARSFIVDSAITEKGEHALDRHKVDNAIIMAAGLSSRFAPISYEKPKGLLTVRGEVLIERQIEQLLEAGIEDITIVVGYKSELFFYLEEKYHANIVVNSEYLTRNNNSSIKRVLDRLGNTYICSSDDYFTENPFEAYVYKAYYSAQYSEGPTNEWCLTCGPKGRIRSVTIGGCDAWYMIGHAYFDRDFSEAFSRLLVAEYDEPQTKDKLWEEIYLDHIDVLDMEIRKYDQGAIFEFDSLDEVKGFDPLFLDNLDSSIFDNICNVLSCKKSEIHDVYPLKQGLTNLSCHFATDSGEFVYRHPGIGTEKIINRNVEQAAQELAKSIGIDDTFIYEDPASGWKISRFLTDCRTLNVENDAELKKAMELARSLHEIDAQLDRSFDYFEEGKGYEALLLEKGKIDITGYEELAQLAYKIREYVGKDDARNCLTHNDFFNLNLLIDETEKLYLIDWEYAGMSDYASDFGTFVVTCMLDESTAEKALRYYFDREPTLEERRHNFAYVGLAGWCWYIWALLKESEGDCVGEWTYTYYRYAKKYLPMALSLYEQGEQQ